MDFFASQDAARRKTGVLLFYFGLAVFLIIVAIYAALTFLFVYQQSKNGSFDPSRLWNTDLFISVVSLTLIVVVVLAKLVGGTLPIIAKTLKLDPAIMASPMITTIVDAVSLFVYFSMATKFLGIA